MSLNKYQQDLFAGLEALVADGDTFYRQEYPLDGKRYWIYNYRLAAYMEFQRPFGRECRGVMFEVDEHDDPVKLAAHPMEKFHNLNECPMTMNLDLSTIVAIDNKADGSLISTYIHDGQLRLKTKGSLFSEQAIDAMLWLDFPEHAQFKQWLFEMHDRWNYTVNLEWCSARLDHRIVIGHQKSHLLVLNARHNSAGFYFPRRELVKLVDSVYMVGDVDTKGLDLVAFVNDIPAMTDDIEGYVVQLASGLRFKVKTDKYLTAHRAKDSINSDRRLFETVIDEAVDDVRALFAHDPLIMARITAMEEKVGNLYNSMVAQVEAFYVENQHCDRKEYAIKGQSEMGMYFGLAMNKYLGRTVDFKGFIKSRWKELGIKDDDSVSSSAHE